MPNVVTFSSGNIIEWVYDAAGMKLRKIVKQGATVQYEQTYTGGLEYRKNGTGSNRVEAIYHAEGRYLNLNAEGNNTLLWQKEYALRDHLGNTRMMFADKNANGIVETPGEITQVERSEIPAKGRGKPLLRLWHGNGGPVDGAGGHGE